MNLFCDEHSSADRLSVRVRASGLAWLWPSTFVSVTFTSGQGH